MSASPLLPALLGISLLSGACTGGVLETEGSLDQAAWAALLDIYLDRSPDKVELLWQRGEHGELSSALPELAPKVRAALAAYSPSDEVERSYGIIYDARPAVGKAHPVRVTQVALRPVAAASFTTDLTTAIPGVLGIGDALQGSGTVWCALLVRAQIRTPADDGSLSAGSAVTADSDRATVTALLPGVVSGRQLLRSVSGFGGSVTYRYVAATSAEAARSPARDACLTLEEGSFNALFGRTLDRALLRALPARSGY